jgi:hypothetical protein
MGFTSWLRTLSSRRAPRARATRRPAPHFRPAVVALEDRWVPSTLVVTSDLGDGSAGTLRAALAAAQKNDTIVFDPAVCGKTIHLGGAELLLGKDVSILGLPDAAITIDGDGASRVFEVVEKAHVRLDHLTITGGHAVWGNNTFGGYGGGVLNFGTLDLYACALSGNDTVDPARPQDISFGGAVANFGTVSAISCELNDNAAQFGGAVYNAGAVRFGDDPRLWNPGAMTLLGCFLGENRAGDSGGAIANWGALEVDRTNVMLNTAGWGGGGILNEGSLTVNGGIVGGNSAALWGGGIFNGGTATVSGCTIAGNAAQFAGGGVITGGTLTISDSQVIGNTALTGGGIYSDTDSKLLVRRSVVTGNAAPDGADVYALGKTLIDQRTDVGVIAP